MTNPDTTSTNAMPETAKPTRILSFDGGGIRGLIPAIWLRELESRLGSPIADHVDLVAGTSTGAILAAAIGLRIPMKRVVALYRERGKQIFPGGATQLWSRASRLFSQGLSHPRYDGVGLSTVLQEVLRTANKTAPAFEDLSGIRGLKVMITSYDTVSREAIVMKSWDPRYAALPLWEVVRASASAPTYFPAHVMTINGAKRALIDGGVVANNPAVAALATATQLARAANTPACEGNQVLLGSFGTGSLQRPINEKHAQEWGAIEWAIPIIDVMFDGSADAIDYFLNATLTSEQYFRCQTGLAAGYDDLDNADETNLNGLASTAMDWLDRVRNGHSGAQYIERLATALKRP